MQSFAAHSLESLRERTSLKWREFDPDVLPAWVAEMDVAVAPPVKRALREAVERDDLGYPPTHTPELGEAFAAFAPGRYGWDVDPGAVRAVPDVIVGVVELLRAVLPAGGTVVFDVPAYPPYFETVVEAGCDHAEVPLRGTPDGWRLDLDGLERAFAAGAGAYLVCTPQNPTGSMWGLGDLRAIVALGARYGVTVISDEIIAPLVLAGSRHVPFLAPEVGAAGDASY